MMEPAFFFETFAFTVRLTSEFNAVCNFLLVKAVFLFPVMDLRGNAQVHMLLHLLRTARKL